MLRVDPPAVQADADLAHWIHLGVAYVWTPPPK